MIDQDTQQQIQQMIDAAIESNKNEVQFQVTQIPAHTHNGVDSNQVDSSYLTAGNVYTPKLTAVTNVTSFTASICNYVRLGLMVTVSGTVTVKPTAASGTELGMSLPIPSKLSLLQQCCGVAFCIIPPQGAIIVADTTNKRASLQFIAASTVSATFSFTYTYQLV